MVQSVRSIASPQNEVCKKCGLFQNCRTPFMESSGASKPDILVIGEAPGETEDLKGIPFVGRAGQLLRHALEEFADISTIRFTNIVRCRPLENKITKRAINYCSQFALHEIVQYNPAIVILLGNSPLNGILEQSSISSWNGVIINKDNRIYLPLYHPAYILRNPAAMDEWLLGMMKLSDEMNSKPRFDRLFPKSLQDIYDMQEYLASCEYISFDVETTTLNPYEVGGSKILSISFAGGDKSYSFPIDHKESWWAVDVSLKTKPCISERERVIGVICDILSSHSGKLIGHNIKFDQAHIFARFGLETIAGGDSMLISHMLDSRQGIHGLKRLAGIHLGMYEYEQELLEYIRIHPEANPHKGGSYDEVPLEILLPYGAMDAEATLMLHDKLYEELSEKQRILYDQLILPVSDMLCRIECNGIGLDSYVAKRYAMIYRKKQEEVYASIENDKYVKKLIKAHNDKSKAKRFKFNPNSFRQLQELYYTYYRMPIIGKTENGMPTTKSSSLKVLESKYPILQKIRYYKLLTKMLTTYLDPAISTWKSSDGRVRTVFNMHGTKTGRLSSGGQESSRKNLQNIPTPEKEPNTLLQILPIKNMFTHSYVRPTFSDFRSKFSDGALISADYSGMELRVFASLANCEPMLDIMRMNRDFHSTVAIMATTGKHIEDVTDDDIRQLDKAVRYRYKWTNWTLLYGGGKETLVHLYDMSEEEAENIIEEYYHRFPEVLDYREKCIKFAEDFGYIESPYGRRERLYYINDDSDISRRNADRRAAVNMPVQSAASDTLLMAMVILYHEMRQLQLEAKLVNTVHDSLLLDVPVQEVEQVSLMCKDVMENVVTRAKEYTDIDMSWLKSPLKVDIEVGTHYGSLMKLEEWKEFIYVG